MALSQLTSRQQTMILLTIGAMFAGVYGVMRYTPQQKNVNSLSQKLKATEEHIKAPKFPDPPDEDGDELKAQAEKLETSLNHLQAQFDSYEQRLPPLESQDVLLKISEAARNANLKFIENVPYVVARRIPVDNTATKGLSKRQQKKIAKKQRKQNIQTGAPAVGELPKEGELMDRLVNDFEEARPLQKVSVEGNFEGLKQFITAVKALPWQVTILKLDIDVSAQSPAQGLPQPLMAKMIIAM